MKSSSVRRRAVTVVVLLAAAGTAASVWFLTGPGDEGAAPAGTAPSSTADEVSAQAAPTIVTEPADPAAVASDAPTTFAGAVVEVVVSYAEFTPGSGLEVNGFVAGRVEDGGTCTAELTSGASRLVLESAAEADASTTSCGLISADPSQIGPGTWTLVLWYRSATSSGGSAPVVVEVPA